MPETITAHHGVEKWTWANVMRDLQVQGGLEEVIIDPLSVDLAGCGGEYVGNRFFISWVKDILLMLTMREHSEPLVKAFTKVIDYPPFCKYLDDNGFTVVEWAKNDANERFAQLERDGAYGLVRLEPPKSTE